MWLLGQRCKWPPEEQQLALNIRKARLFLNTHRQSVQMVGSRLPEIVDSGTGFGMTFEVRIE